jgi:hypothetical protein
MQDTLDVFKNIEGEKLCEVKLRADQRTWRLVSFNAPNVWWHGIADLVVINEAKGFATEAAETSKSARYADTKQLDLVAAGLFATFPKINKVKSALIFTVSKEFVQATRSMMPKYLEQPAKDVARIEAALENGVWNPAVGHCASSAQSSSVSTRQELIMPYVNKPRPYKKEYQQQKARGENMKTGWIDNVQETRWTNEALTVLEKTSTM